MRLSPQKLQLWTGALLAGAGVPNEEAVRAAEVFTLATLRGLGHHDVTYLPQRLDWLTSGQVNAKPRLHLVSSTAATEVWDGDEGLGEVLCHHITLRALDLARSQGLGYAAVRRSNHFLAAAPYTEIGSRDGFLVMVWTNTDAGMSLPGGHTRQIGNNPLGFAVGSGETALSADLCLAYSSLGNLNSLATKGERAPANWGRDSLGNPTDDPRELLAGAVGPIAGPKGLALALLGEILTGVLSGGPTLDEVTPGGGLRTHNQMVLAWDLEAFGGRTAVEDRVASLHRRTQALAPGGRLPGDRSRKASAEGRADGIVLDRATVEKLLAWSARLGVTAPDTL